MDEKVSDTFGVSDTGAVRSSTDDKKVYDTLEVSDTGAVRSIDFAIYFTVTPFSSSLFSKL
jgi:hypothetical protein